MRSGHVSKGKDILIKNNVPRDIDMIGRNMETFIPFMKRTVAQKHTLLRTEIKFMTVIRSKMRPASTPKYLKKGVVRCFIKKSLKRSFHLNGATRKPIDEKTGCSKSIIPIA